MYLINRGRGSWPAKAYLFKLSQTVCNKFLNQAMLGKCIAGKVETEASSVVKAILVLWHPPLASDKNMNINWRITENIYRVLVMGFGLVKTLERRTPHITSASRPSYYNRVSEICSLKAWSLCTISGVDLVVEDYGWGCWRWFHSLRWSTCCCREAIWEFDTWRTSCCCVLLQMTPIASYHGLSVVNKMWSRVPIMTYYLTLWPFQMVLCANSGLGTRSKLF